MKRKTNNTPKHDRNIDSARQAPKNPYLDDSNHEDKFFSQFRDIFSFSPRFSLNDSGMAPADKVIAISLVLGIAAVGAYAYLNHMDEKSNPKDGCYPSSRISGSTSCDHDVGFGDGLKDSDEEKIYHTDPSRLDTDGDKIRDGAEVFEFKTNPTSIDTDADGIDDFTESFVYPDYLNATDPSDAEKFIERLPDVKAGEFGTYLWQLERENMGPCHNCFSYYLNEPFFALFHVLEVSERDPLMKYYAERTRITFPDGKRNGTITVDYEPLLKGNVDFSGGKVYPGVAPYDMETYKSSGEIELINPSFFFTQCDRKGSQKASAIAAYTLLHMKNMNPEIKTERVGERDVYWVEFSTRNNKTYAVSGNDVYNLDDFRKMNCL